MPRTNAALVAERVREAAGGPLAALAVQVHVDELVPEGHESNDRGSLVQRLLVCPAHVHASASAFVEGPVRSLALVGAIRLVSLSRRTRVVSATT
jgi:hypothetical protein